MISNMLSPKTAEPTADWWATPGHTAQQVAATNNLSEQSPMPMPDPDGGLR